MPNMVFLKSAGSRAFEDAEGKWAWLYNTAGHNHSGISLECPRCTYTRDLHYVGSMDLIEARARLLRWCSECKGPTVRSIARRRELHKEAGKSSLLRAFA